MTSRMLTLVNVIKDFLNFFLSVGFDVIPLMQSFD